MYTFTYRARIDIPTNYSYIYKYTYRITQNKYFYIYGNGDLCVEFHVVDSFVCRQRWNFCIGRIKSFAKLSDFFFNANSVTWDLIICNITYIYGVTYTYIHYLHIYVRWTFDIHFTSKYAARAHSKNRSFAAVTPHAQWKFQIVNV